MKRITIHEMTLPAADTIVLADNETIVRLEPTTHREPTGELKAGWRVTYITEEGVAYGGSSVKYDH